MRLLCSVCCVNVTCESVCVMYGVSAVCVMCVVCVYHVYSEWCVVCRVV